MSGATAESLGPRSRWERLCSAGLAVRAPDGYVLRHEGLALLVPPESWDRTAVPEVLARDGSACRYCRGTDDITIVHVVPRIQGGGDAAHNLVAACRRCNSRKNGRTPEQAGMALLPIGGA